MPDDTVQVFPETRTTPEMKERIRKHGGVEYYWRSVNPDGEYWYCTYPSDDMESEPYVDLPDIVKLAVMLE